MDILSGMPRRALGLGFVVALSLAATACMGPAGPSRQAGRPADFATGAAEPLPGLAALLPRGAAIVESDFLPVSCSGPGECTAVGNIAYELSGRLRSDVNFVTDERDGAWQPARLLPGRVVTARDGQSAIEGLSCSSPGNCTAVVRSTYGAPATVSRLFITAEKDGTWGMPAPAPGVSSLSADAGNSRISCEPAGNCLIAGVVVNASSHGDQVFALTESGGRWSSASTIPGLPAGDGGGDVMVNGVSCDPSGACTVAGEIFNSGTGTGDGFIATETTGKWRRPTLLPHIVIQAVACPAAGDCTAVGQAAPGATLSGFAVTRHDGRWGAPVRLSGMASVTSVSCSAAGTCSAGGTAFPHPGDQAVDAAVTTEDGGAWEPARLLDTSRLPGATPAEPPAASGPLVDSQVTSVSCTPTGDCLAAGFYIGRSTARGAPREAFLAFRRSGTWSAAGTIPGLPGLDGARGSSVTAIAYSGAGRWTLTGTYDAGNTQDPIQAYLMGDNEPFLATVPAA